MIKTQQLDRAKLVDDLAARHDDAIAPGRTTRSAALVGPNGPMPSGLLMRKARDANGVEDNAGDAVARASSSSGAPLPDTLMRKFEASLGTDLSSVRVHTGSDSATAANAVGAKAYTVGQDIHFGDGRFEPSSLAGEHLLAHEVAHTVQQHGGVARVQRKPSVSSPGDAHELEADRAADAMVSGGTFAIAGFGGGLQRKADVAKLSVAQVDGTFNAIYKKVLARPESKSKGGDALIQTALQETKQQIGAGMPDGYVPPPVRDGGAPGPRVDGAKPDPLAPDPQSIAPSAGGSSSGSEGGREGSEKKEGAEKEGAEEGGPEFAIAFPKKGPFNLELAATKDGELSASGKWELKELPEIIVPVLTGVFVKVKPEFTGAVGFKGDAKKHTWTASGGLNAACSVSIEGGLPHLASLGGGATLEGDATVSGGWSQATGWSMDGFKFDLSAALFVHATLGAGEMEMEFKTTFAKLNLLTATIGAGGFKLTAGKQIKELGQALLGYDKEKYEQWQRTYQKMNHQCQEDTGSSSPECSTGGGGGPGAGGTAPPEPAPPPE